MKRDARGRSFVAIADEIVATGARHVQSALRITAQNFREELARATEVWRGGGTTTPAFAYGPPPVVDAAIRAALEQVAHRAADEGPIAGVLAARAEELLVEACIAEAVGTDALEALAKTRFARADRFDSEADAVATQWIEEARAGTTVAPSAERADDGPLHRSSDERDPKSLVSLLRTEIGKRRLPVRVVVDRHLAPLAGVANGVVLVSADRMIDERAAMRTVLHEIEGHLEPDVRAHAATLAIFAAATAHGSDDQEGYAIAIERRGGFLDGRRKGELAFRHLAVRSFALRATFVEVVERLVGDGAAIEDAVRIAMRAHRGGHDGRGGLGRERVYIPSLLRVEDALTRDPSLEHVLASGRVSVDAADVLRAVGEPG